MKKNFKSLYLFFIMAVFINFLFPSRLALARSYEVSKYEAAYEILDNTDVEVVEAITYDFSGQYGGVYRDIDLSGTGGIDNIKVFVIRDGKEVEVSSNSFEESRFEVLNYMNNKRIKVYEPSNSVEKTIIYKYKLKGLAEKYNDTGTFNRKVIDSKWEVPLNSVVVNIKIPEGAKKEELKIFSHGDLTGFDEILDNRNFTLKVAKVNPGETVETQILFPKELLKNATNVKIGDIVNDVLKREAVNAEESNRQRDLAKQKWHQEESKRNNQMELQAIGKKLSPIALGAGGFGIVASILAAIKYGRNKKAKFTGDYYRELPEDYSPAVMAYLMYNGKTESKEIMATLLDLARKNIISITEEKSNKKGIFGRVIDDSDFIIKPIDNANISSLMEHELFLYNWFIKELGHGEALSLDDLTSRLKGRSFGVNFARNFSSFKSIVQDEVANYEFWEANNLKGIFPFVLLTLLIGAFGAVLLFVLYNGLGLVPLLVAGLSLFTILGLAVTKKLTIKGVEHKAMWSAFKRFLLDFSNLKDSEIPALSIWKHYLVYATSLGVAKEVMAQLPKVYGKEAFEAEMQLGGGYYPIFYSTNGFTRMDNAISNSVNEAFNQVRLQQIANSARSSSSGSGGGFSMGSSGGSGGGGGGGAF